MAETDVVVVLASMLSCHIGRHSPDNSRTGLNNSIFCIPLGGATARVTPGQCQQSQRRSTLIDDYLLRPRMSVQGQTRRFASWLATSGLPRGTDIVSGSQLVRFVPKPSRRTLFDHPIGAG